MQLPHGYSIPHGYSTPQGYPKILPPSISPTEAESTNDTSPPDYPPPKYYKNAYNLRIYNILQKIKIKYPELSDKINNFDDYNKKKNVFNILQLCISKEELKIIFNIAYYNTLDNIHRDNLNILYHDILNRIFNAFHQRNILINKYIHNVNTNDVLLYKIIMKVQYITSLFKIRIRTDYMKILHMLFLIYKTPSIAYKSK